MKNIIAREGPTADGRSSSVRAAAPRRRGRPSLKETAFISSKILTAARNSFLELPFDDVSIETIACAAGVERNTVYKRFPDKQAALRAVLSEELARWSVEKVFDEVDGNVDRVLKVWAVQMLRHAAVDEVNIWSRLAEAAWPRHEELGSRHEALGYDRVVDKFELVISSGNVAAEPRFVATALMAILTNWTDLTRLSAEATDDDMVKYAHAAVDLVLHGCLRR